MNCKPIVAYMGLNLALFLGFVSTVFGLITIVPESRTQGLVTGICIGLASLGLTGLAIAWKAKWVRAIGPVAALFALAGIYLSANQWIGGWMG